LVIKKRYDTKVKKNKKKTNQADKKLMNIKAFIIWKRFFGLPVLFCIKAKT